MSKSNWLWMAGVLAAGFVVGCMFLLAAYVATLIFPQRPMTCNEHQVQVWVEYPTNTRCVDETDHEQHMSAR